MSAILSSDTALQPLDPCTYAAPELASYYDAKYQIEWMYMRGSNRGCFTPTLLQSLQSEFEALATQTDREVRYAVLASEIPGIYNLGGDLALFKQHIEHGNREGLLQYAVACIDALYLKMTGFRRDITHITLVQGDALGGGMECALSADVLIAEQGTSLGLPEILFNLFPGMGAYSILSRKIGPAQAERMILSGKLYAAEELYEMGVVDVLAEAGKGEMAVYDYVKREEKARNGIRAVRAVRDIVNPVTYEELIQVTERWVDAAMQLRPRDLRMMDRLVKRQSGALARRSA
jgi:DSF synthase